MEMLGLVLFIILLISPLWLIIGLIKPSIFRLKKRIHVVVVYISSICVLFFTVIAFILISPTKKLLTADQQKHLKQQTEFCEIINKYDNEYNIIDRKDFYIDKESQLEAIFLERNIAIAKIVSDLSFTNWQGKIKEMSSSFVDDGKIYLTIDLGCKTSTTLVSQDLIPTDSVIYEKLRKFTINSKVIVSGDFFFLPGEGLKEGSLTQWGAMQAPEFQVKFTDIKER